MSTYVRKEVDVEVDLENFDTDELIEELSRRGHDYNTREVDGDHARTLLEAVYHQRRRNQSYDRALDQLIWYVLGRCQ